MSKFDLSEETFYDYESPITKVIQQVEQDVIRQEEDALVCEVSRKIGFDIDKDRLIKALQYDSDQYDKGYLDGLRCNFNSTLNAMRAKVKNEIILHDECFNEISDMQLLLGVIDTLFDICTKEVYE